MRRYFSSGNRGSWACGLWQLQPARAVVAKGPTAQWAQVQNVYQRRADLIPNLVATVSGSANFEKSTLAEVTAARASVGQVKIDPNSAPTDPAKLAEFEKAQGALTSALSRLLVVSEHYPDLKASAGFRDLQAQLEGTENRISVERGRFNDAVQALQYGHPVVPRRVFCREVWLHGQALFRRRRGRGETAAGAVRFQQTRSRQTVIA